MSKIFLIGDVHLGMSYPNNYDKWFNVAKEYFSKFLLPLAKKELSKDDIIVQLGDLFDNRNYIPIDILNYGQYIIEELSSICPVHILVGNHDMYNKSSGDINSIKSFSYIPNVHIYENSRVIDYLGKSILMMPYIEKRDEQSDILKKYSGCDYLFCHSDLNGAKMHLTSVAHRNKNKIDVEDFSGYKNVKTGHIHIQQTIKNVTFVGSIFEMDRNDLGNQKGIFILDVIENTEKFIINDISPRYKKVYIRQVSDIDTLDQISTRDYIDLYISNSLLINNRKLRRKLELMLQSGNFASVEYIDDLVVIEEGVKNEEDVSDVSEDNIIDIVSIKLDYTDMIKDYIKNQKYNSDGIKEGILGAFSEVIDIYNDINAKIKD
jgi:DNA repair exonuclease SbcCD nuclease subunit